MTSFLNQDCGYFGRRTSLNGGKPVRRQYCGYMESVCFLNSQNGERVMAPTAGSGKSKLVYVLYHSFLL
jgi:hypothetical protein